MVYTDNNNIALETKDLCKKIPLAAGSSLNILHNLSLSVAYATSVAITGTSGSGKTTLLGLLAGLDIPTSGRICLFEQDISQLNEDERAALRLGKVGFVFQSFHLMDNLSALENVMLPLELSTTTRSGEIKELAISALESVGLPDRLEHLPKRLSGGEQQRVALARAFVSQPKILFADEPTGNLDQETGDEIIELLFGLQKQYQTTLVMVTHDKDLASQCDVHYTLQNHQLVVQA
ncbi:MAG: ABC transporter [uncultured Thiotrichaceae bacterium]|uniref:ABC transporter n=1 Tax=uncultured Thiotrichaceae bacterium TaxID=298394 RepID=A0A6S6TJS6_9GAMM|nr:MAG: ABC transporter [uncultured Thiotrichaceae bacterium]